VQLNEAISIYRSANPEYAETSNAHHIGCGCADCISLNDDLFSEMNEDTYREWIDYTEDVTLHFEEAALIVPYIPDDRQAEYDRLTTLLD